MYSPHAQNNHSPFISLKNSSAQMTSYSHSRTNSGSKSISQISQATVEMVRVPSTKKLSLTYQAAQYRPQKAMHEGEEQLKKRILPESQMKGRFVSLQTNPINEKPQFLADEGKSISQHSLMMYFQQKAENLKKEYLNSLKEYEIKIDELQTQLCRNSLELQSKDIQINKLVAAIKGMKKQQKQKPEQMDYTFQLRIEDLEKRLSMLTDFAEEQSRESQQRTEDLATKVISCFGSRLSVIRERQAEFLKIVSAKIASVEQKIELKQKQEQSIGTRGSMQSVQQLPTFSKIEDQGVSFWDDCFFYPGERSENCSLVAEMSSRRSEPLNCWIDNQGYMRYCDSGSFLFNRKGEKIIMSSDELQWLKDHHMVKVY